jgi:hypothetical protein
MNFLFASIKLLAYSENLTETSRNSLFCHWLVFSSVHLALNAEKIRQNLFVIAPAFGKRFHDHERLSASMQGQNRRCSVSEEGY